jgi:hypothetical protein
VRNLIIDNSQAFFSKPMTGVDTFYSPRKFFGVPDGGYLYTDTKLDIKIEQDFSWNRMDHLTIRIDRSAEEGYSYFLRSNQEMINQPIKVMSKLTLALLSSISYMAAQKIRYQNFLCLHEKLNSNNLLDIETLDLKAPMIYPFLCDDGERLKKKLISNKIFVATYWKNNIIKVGNNSNEAYIISNLVPLPIDQRLGKNEINMMLQILKTHD